MASNEMEQQIAAEERAILDAPRIPLSQLQPEGYGLRGRCHWCGRWSTDLELVEVRDGQERYKGRCCRPISGGQ